MKSKDKKVSNARSIIELKEEIKKLNDLVYDLTMRVIDLEGSGFEPENIKLRGKQ